MGRVGFAALAAGALALAAVVACGQDAARIPTPPATPDTQAKIVAMPAAPVPVPSPAPVTLSPTPAPATPRLALETATPAPKLAGATRTPTSKPATPTATATLKPLTDREILSILYHSTNGPDWAENDNWLSDKPLDQWYGVTTNDDGRVVVLNLVYNRLKGPIPTQLGQLSRLAELNLWGNGLSGQIPPELGRLRHVTSLHLEGNDFTGCLPNALSLVQTHDVWELRMPLCSGLPSIPGRIAFHAAVYQGWGKENWDVYVMNPDGTNTTRLTIHPAEDVFPAWSPDGKRIAFVSDRDGDIEIYVMAADGSDVTRITNSPGEDNLPIWSPDGRRIAFTSNRDGNYEIYVMAADGSEVTRLTDSPMDDYATDWSPDGKLIALTSGSDEDYDIYVMAADGSEVTRLTDIPGIAGSAKWSPDGKRIVFGYGDYYSDIDSNIYVMAADGSEVTRVTDYPSTDQVPIWSPDGQRLAFASFRGGNTDIYVMNADGTGVTPVNYDTTRKHNNATSWTAAAPAGYAPLTPRPQPRGPYAISAGSSHTCVLRADGSPVCWGADEYGQASPPSGETLAAISGGGWHTCGLRLDGSPVCWGTDSYGQSSPPPGEKFATISAGGSHTCALHEDESPICWGADDYGQSSPPPGETFTQLASSNGYTCGIREDNSVLCWGDVEVKPALRVQDLPLASISGGSSVACGLTTTRMVACWNKEGVIHGPDVGRDLVYLGSHISNLSEQYLCGIRHDGSALCWWADTDGDDLELEELPSSLQFVSVTTGSSHGCGVQEGGAVACWGSNYDGELDVPAELRAMSAAPLPEVSVECEANMVVKKGTGCFVEDYDGKANFVVTAQGRADMYGGDGRLSWSGYSCMDMAQKSAGSGGQGVYVFIRARANTDGSWTIYQANVWLEEPPYYTECAEWPRR